MGQTTDQIENQIENKREDLKSNLQELETRVKTATDWRHYFAEHTGTMIAAAFGGGVLLASMLGGRSNRASLSQAGGSSEPARPWTTRNQTRGSGKPGFHKERVGRRSRHQVQRHSWRGGARLYGASC